MSAPVPLRSFLNRCRWNPFRFEPAPQKSETPKDDAPKNDIKDMLEARLAQSLAALKDREPESSSVQTLSDHLALFARWYYRPAARRVGEIVFAGAGGEISRKPLLRAIARVAARAAGIEVASAEKSEFQAAPGPGSIV